MIEQRIYALMLLAFLCVGVRASSQSGVATPDQVVISPTQVTVRVRDGSGKDVGLELSKDDLVRLKGKALAIPINKKKRLSDDKASANRHTLPGKKQGGGGVNGASKPVRGNVGSQAPRGRLNPGQPSNNTASAGEAHPPDESAAADKSQQRPGADGDPSGADKKLSKDDVMKLAEDLGLLERSRVNPGLVFRDDDARELSNRPLDETQVRLELAARKAVLEAADRQGVVISNAANLSQAVSIVLPIIVAQDPTVRGESRPANSADQSKQQPAICGTSGDTSQVLIEHAWDALNKKSYDQAAACAQVAITKWSRQADQEQARAFKDGCQETPSAEQKENYFRLNWALSDIATGWFIRGEAFYGNKQWAQAREAYKRVIDSYSCSFTWDPRGWFWRTADVAQEKYDEIRYK
jgi:hypothetical protein